jgi:hypothetical protein
MNTDILLTLGDIALLTSIPALGLFVGYYYFGSPWKKLLVGRSLMYFAVSLLIISVIVLLSLFLGPDYPGREWVRLIGYVGVSITTWRLFFTLRHIQKNPPIMPDQLGLTDFPEEEILALADEIRARQRSSMESDDAR